MSKGYASEFINEVRTADPAMVGVRLGLVCISKDIPVTDVSKFFNVSRVTVYAWFRGKTNVPDKHREKIKKLVDKLS
jgi:hypothetical protein